MSTLPIQRQSISVIQASNLPFNADAFQCTNPDVNGNYQTVTYYRNNLSGEVITTLTITYDGSSNVTSVTKS
jgi:hypothetical protein